MTQEEQAFTAARAGDVATLRARLDAGVPIEARNARGDGLLMLAAYYGHADACAFLLGRGASTEAINEAGQLPLAGAAFKGLVDVVGVLLDHGAAVDGAGPDGRTALMYAAMFDHVEVIELLLARGADAARKDAAGLDAGTLARTMGASRAAQRLERA